MKSIKYKIPKQTRVLCENVSYNNIKILWYSTLSLSCVTLFTEVQLSYKVV